MSVVSEAESTCSTSTTPETPAAKAALRKRALAKAASAAKLGGKAVGAAGGKAVGAAGGMRSLLGGRRKKGSQGGAGGEDES